MKSGDSLPEPVRDVDLRSWLLRLTQAREISTSAQCSRNLLCRPYYSAVCIKIRETTPSEDQKSGSFLHLLPNRLEPRPAFHSGPASGTSRYQPGKSVVRRGGDRGCCRRSTSYLRAVARLHRFLRSRICPVRRPIRETRA